MKDFNEQWLLPVLLVLVAGGAAWLFFFRGEAPEPGPAQIETLPVEPPARTPRGPLYPLPPADDTAARDLTPLPPLTDSDAYAELAMVDLFGRKLEALLDDEALIEKFVATVDNLPPDRIADRIRPVGKPEEPFLVEGGEEDGAYEISPANYDRYEPLVRMLENADIDAVIETYQRFYPLLQEAYEDLGYPDAYFNDRLVEVIDHLLDTPEVERPVEVVRPNVLYEYADPELEALSSGRKLMIRIGPENAARVKTVLRDLRDRLAVPGNG